MLVSPNLWEGIISASSKTQETNISLQTIRLYLF